MELPNREKISAQTESELLAEPGSIERALFEVYGPHAPEDFEKFRKEHPEFSPEEALNRWQEYPTSQMSFFFRLQNIRTAAQELVSKLQKQEQEPIKILDIGVSDGKEAYSMAVHMLDAGHTNFSIHGIDVSVDRLAEAESGEYKLELDRIEQLGADYLHSSHLTEEVVKKQYFRDAGKRWKRTEFTHKYPIRDILEKTKRGQAIPKDAYRDRNQLIVEPTEKLRDHITFGLHDIIDGPLPDQYDIIVMNNVLPHYPDRTRDKITKNTLASLQPGGFLVLEHPGYMYFDTKEESEHYKEWREEMAEKFGLIPVATGEKPEWTYVTGQFYQLPKK